MIRHNNELTAIEVLMEMFDPEHNAEGFLVQLCVLAFGRRECTRSVGDWSFAVVLHSV